MTMDKLLKAEIIATIKTTMKEILEGSDEIWLTADQLMERFQMLSPEWMRHNAKLLPRERAVVVQADGERKATRWAYPMHKINRMIQERKLINLKSQ